MRIRGNRISGASAAAIAIGQESEAFGSYGASGKIVNNDLSGFTVLPCDANLDFTNACNDSTAILRTASTRKVWLGPNTSDTKVVLPESGGYPVADLSEGGSGNRARY